MDPTTFITAVLLGIVLGLAAGLAVGRARGAREQAERHTQLTADTASAQARLEETVRRVAALDSALMESQRELASCKERLAGVVAQLDTERTVGAERQSLLEQADERLRAAFTTVSAEARSGPTTARSWTWPRPRSASSRNRPRATLSVASRRSATSSSHSTSHW